MDISSRFQPMDKNFNVFLCMTVIMIDALSYLADLDSAVASMAIFWLSLLISIFDCGLKFQPWRNWSLYNDVINFFTKWYNSVLTRNLLLDYKNPYIKRTFSFRSIVKVARMIKPKKCIYFKPQAFAWIKLIIIEMLILLQVYCNIFRLWKLL